MKKKNNNNNKFTKPDKLTVLSSRYIVFDKKSIPMVACKAKKTLLKNNNAAGFHAKIILIKLQNQQRKYLLCMIENC